MKAPLSLHLINLNEIHKFSWRYMWLTRIGTMRIGGVAKKVLSFGKIVLHSGVNLIIPSFLRVVKKCKDLSATPFSRSNCRLELLSPSYHLFFLFYSWSLRRSMQKKTWNLVTLGHRGFWVGFVSSSILGFSFLPSWTFYHLK